MSSIKDYSIDTGQVELKRELGSGLSLQSQMFDPHICPPMHLARVESTILTAVEGMRTHDVGV